MPRIRIGRVSPRRAAVALAALLLAALLSPVTPGSGPAEAAEYKPWGRTWAPDQVLRRGCRKYRIHYKIDPPTSDWVAEIYLTNPNGKNLGFVVKWDEFHPASAWHRFEVCRRATRFGVHRIRVRVYWYENDPEKTAHVGWLRPGRFRLTRP